MASLKLHNEDACHVSKNISFNSGWKALNIKKINKPYIFFNKISEGKGGDKSSDVLIRLLKRALNKIKVPKIKACNITMGSGGRSPPKIISIVTLLKLILNIFTKSFKITFQSISSLHKIIILGICAGLLIGFLGCTKWNSLEPIIPNNQVTQQEQYYFNGDNILVDVTPEYKSSVQAQVKAPYESSYSALETLTESNGKFTKTFTSTTNGDYNVKFIITPEKAVEETKEVQVPVYMNEAQSDQALEEVIASQTNNSSTNQYDILRILQTNSVDNLNGNWYTNDIMIRIRDPSPAGARDHIIDIRGSKNDVYSSVKHSDANAAGFGYAHIGPCKSKVEVSANVQELKDAGWQP